MPSPLLAWTSYRRRFIMSKPPGLRLLSSHALLLLPMLLLELVLLTPTAHAFTNLAAVPSRRRLVTPILKAAASSSPSSSTPPVRSHPYDNLQQQASLWGGHSHFGKRYIFAFVSVVLALHSSFLCSFTRPRHSSPHPPLPPFLLLYNQATPPSSSCPRASGLPLAAMQVMLCLWRMALPRWWTR